MNLLTPRLESLELSTFSKLDVDLKNTAFFLLAQSREYKLGLASHNLCNYGHPSYMAQLLSTYLIRPFLHLTNYSFPSNRMTSFRPACKDEDPLLARILYNAFLPVW